MEECPRSEARAASDSFTLKTSKYMMERFYHSQNTRVYGLENCLKLFSRGEPLITFANHQSYCDDPFIWCPLPEEVRESERFRNVIAARENFESVLKWFSPKDNLRLLFVNRGGSEQGGGLDQEAFFKANEILYKDGWIHLFPEGKIIQECGVMIGKFKPGLANMILSCYEPIRLKMHSEYKYSTKQQPLLIPVVHFGMHNVLPIHQWPQTNQEVSIFYGEPISLEDFLKENHPTIIKDLTLFLEDQYLSFYLECFNKVFQTNLRRVDLVENEYGYCHHLEGLKLLRYAPQMVRVRRVLREKKYEDSLLREYIKLLREKEESLLSFKTITSNDKLTRYNLERLECNLFSTRKALIEAQKKLGYFCWC